MPLIFGLPFLELNDIVCDHKRCACIVQHKKLNYNLLMPIKRQEPMKPKVTLCKQLLQNKTYKKETLCELIDVFQTKWKHQILPELPNEQLNYTTSILHHVKTLEMENSMSNLETNLLKTFTKVFQPSHTLTNYPYNLWPGSLLGASGNRGIQDK